MGKHLGHTHTVHGGQTLARPNTGQPGNTLVSVEMEIETTPCIPIGRGGAGGKEK